MATVVTIDVPGHKGDPGDHVPALAPYSATGTITFDLGDIPSLHNINLTGNVTVGTLPDGKANVAGAISISFVQPATGGPYTVTFPASIKWAGGAPAPTMPSAAGSELIVHLFWTVRGWRGVVMGTYF